MIKNIIFDLGNVLINFKPDKFLLRYTKNEKYINSFISKVIRDRIWLNLDRGVISLENAKNEFIEKYPEDANFILTFFEDWMEMLTPIEENIKILYELKSNSYKIYILSNYILEAYHYVKSIYEFISVFDGEIISGKEKVIKPEPEIYQKLVQKYKLIPKECVFIDDIPTCLLYARKIKMKTILYLPNVDLRRELRKLEVKI
ncbi:MAG: HAD family hydrolase [Promethearchaeota archaeon]